MAVGAVEADLAVLNNLSSDSEFRFEFMRITVHVTRMGGRTTRVCNSCNLENVI